MGRGVRGVRGKCRMQNAECKMQNAKLFFLPKFSNFPNFSKSKPSQEYQKLEFKQMRARHTRNPLAQFTKRK